MIVVYDYTDAKSGPPRNFAVTVESDDDLKAAVGLLLSRELNKGRDSLTTFQLESALSTRPDYRRRP